MQIKSEVKIQLRATTAGTCNDVMNFAENNNYLQNFRYVKNKLVVIVLKPVIHDQLSLGINNIFSYCSIIQIFC